MLRVTDDEVSNIYKGIYFTIDHSRELTAYKFIGFKIEQRDA